MKINTQTYKSPNFTGANPNKIALNSLEFISEHAASFSAGVSFVSAMALRPMAISLTPNAKKENKQYLNANSFASGLIKLGVAEAIAIPIEKAVKKIDENPAKFLKQKTVDNLADGASDLVKSKNYKFATQTIKTGANFISAIPKSALTVALIPIIMDKIFRYKKVEKNNFDNTKVDLYNKQIDPVFKKVYDKTNFTGFSDKLAVGIGKVLDTDFIQRFAKNGSKHSDDVARNMSVATDVLLLSAYAATTNSSKKIEEKKKKVLIASEFLSTGICIFGGLGVDKLLKKCSEKPIEKFKELYKNDPKLPKYLEGINILRPTLVFAIIYYAFAPFITTLLSNKAEEM